MEYTQIKILLVDDQPAVLMGLKMLLLLEKDFEVIGEAPDGETALQLYIELNPNVVVMDLELPGKDGIETTTALRRLDPSAKVIMISIHGDMSKSRSRDAGAIAFVEKRGDVTRLVSEIRKAFHDL
jgi:DNA-binding NarL/FixJ family response regulator